MWNETTKNTLELFDNIWGKQNKVVTVDHCVKFATPVSVTNVPILVRHLTTLGFLKLAMFVIASAG